VVIDLLSNDGWLKGEVAQDLYPLPLKDKCLGLVDRCWLLTLIYCINIGAIRQWLSQVRACCSKPYTNVKQVKSLNQRFIYENILKMTSFITAQDSVSSFW